LLGLLALRNEFLPSFVSTVQIMDHFAIMVAHNQIFRFLLGQCGDLLIGQWAVQKADQEVLADFGAKQF